MQACRFDDEVGCVMSKVEIEKVLSLVVIVGMVVCLFLITGCPEGPKTKTTYAKHCIEGVVYITPGPGTFGPYSLLVNKLGDPVECEGGE